MRPGFPGPAWHIHRQDGVQYLERLVPTSALLVLLHFHDLRSVIRPCSYSVKHYVPGVMSGAWVRQTSLEVLHGCIWYAAVIDFPLSI